MTDSRVREMAEWASRIRLPFGRRAEEPLGGPIRGKLLGAEGLAAQARAVARRQKIAPPRRRWDEGRLLRRLDDSLRLLEDARARLGAAAERDIDVAPAGEWLLDNFYVVEEHAREVRRNLPRGYYRELPKLASGTLAGHPRVYELAIELIAHTEGRLDEGNIELFVREFQRFSPLAIGELWAIPAMLRLALFENIRRMTLRTVQRLDEAEAADAWASRMREASDPSGSALSEVLAAFVNDHPPLTPTFVARFLHQIRGYQTTFTPLIWLEQFVAEEGMGVEDAVRKANQRAALTQVVMANSITSLRTISRLGWRDFVEANSVLEATLATDPAGAYRQMTFGSRDRYRHVVEEVARGSGCGEQEVAELALDLARRAAGARGMAPRQSHVGYYLIDTGRSELEAAVGFTPGPRERLARALLAHANTVYFGGLVAAVLLVLAAALALIHPATLAGTVAVILLSLVPASEVAATFVNQMVTRLMSPRRLPKLEFREGGIPEEYRTVVVVPTLFASEEAVAEALHHLEVQFLANRDRRLHFALLSDFVDSPHEHNPDDEGIVAAAVNGVRELNTRYAGGADETFYLFHRPRLWNEQQGVWMGWERKRGKLAQFNHFLRGNAGEAYSTIVGEVELIRRSRYVLTLDSDTVLPRESAQLLVGTLAHPLNRAVYDPHLGRVIAGYGILQPRVGVSLPSAYRSRFAAVQSRHPGVDPYTTAVSDVYQDLFGEGSFAGKGIYDVDAFERATRGRFPENTLLSHDLIEGAYARAGLVTDAELYDDYPSSYLSFARRKHRWIRGDWQLLRWLRSPVPGPDGPEENRLSPLSRWKIFDNLRRSVVEIFQLALLAAGWTVLPDTAVAWTLLGVAFIAFPWIFPLLMAAVTPPREDSWRAYYASIGRETIAGVQQFFVTLAFLPHQAWVSLDAIVRTLHRLRSGRKLLEWQTASQVERVTVGGSREIWRRMLPATLLAAAIGALVVVANRAAGPLALVLPLLIVLLWLGAPLLARALRRPAVELPLRLTDSERDLAFGYALLHWRFFERFVTPATNWLAPDNYQEEPEPTIAMRTSPTNIGLQLLATVSAWDLGFVTLGEMVLRLERAFQALERMERFRGHFYNWYELDELQVLQPAYISTVDSGNLAGHLIALKQACLGVADEPLQAARSAHALRTGLELAKAELRELGRARLRDPAGRRIAEAAEARVDAAAAHLRSDAGTSADPASAVLLAELRAALADLGDADDVPAPAAEARHWLRWTLRVAERWHDELAALAPSGAGETAPTLRELSRHSTLASQQLVRLEILASRAETYASEMDFRFLFDERQKLFSIGFLHSAHSYDPSYYDLLASEARLASFMAIAKGDVPPEHWFRLGRSLVGESGATALISWSGSMFEYLMPLLVMQSFPNTLLDLTYRGALRRQIAYGGDRGTPWGVSESAYNLRDRSGTYQYRAFGVPDLALKRGLSKDLVVAPYASVLAMLVSPTRALRNLRVLEGTGALGPYGFRDAVDYTRPAPGANQAVVNNYMAHHVGMSLLALVNALADRLWQRRFHADPLVRSAELVLYERIPRKVVLQKAQPREGDGGRSLRDTDRPAVRQVDDPDTPQPRIGLLGADPYAVLLTHAGGGYSRAGSMAVTRWRADGTRDNEGQWAYVRDVGSGRSWSGAYQPTCAPADSYRATFAVDRVTFRRRDGDLETFTEIAVVADDAAEVRRVTLTNHSDEPHTVEVTSYGEIVLQPPDADRAHPAFGNLFVETEWVPEHTAVLATRRPRSGDEPRVWCAHVAATSVYAGKMGPVSCETDRARFVGRGRSTRHPAALDKAGELSGTVGAVLDPIFALRVPLAVMPGETARVAFTTLVAPTRERALELADRYCDLHAALRALDLSWTHAQVELRDLLIAPAEAALYQQLAGHLFFAEPAMRPPPQELGEATANRAALWGLGISGDWPILLAMIHSEAGIPSVRRLLQAHHYWRLKGVTADLVILNTHASGYLQELGDALLATVVASSEAGMMDKPGGIFIHRADLLSAEELSVLRATARVHVQSDGIGLGDLLEVPEIGPAYPPALEPTKAPSRPRRPRRPDLAPLRFDNGLGGVNADGDYEIRLDPGDVTPAPWANVVANPIGGFCVTERGGGFSWALNSYFFRLTPWRNDPVEDLPGEVLYLRDDASGEIWSATPAPVDDGRPYRVRHCAGASLFEHDHDGIVSELTMGMAEDEPVKISKLVLVNRGDVVRQITLTSYVEWTLGVNREHTQHQLKTAFDPASGALFAGNAFEPEFAGMTAFSWISTPVDSYTADRREFLGRNGAPADPAALRRAALAEATGSGVDPCAALQTTFSLEPGKRREIIHLLGAAEGDEAARVLIERLSSAAEQALEDGTRRWRERLGTLQVRTPDPAFDALLNGWALYQALSCRMWARSALYQSSGAYGFRDQLQDGMAFVYAEPAVTREHILRAAGRQFTEGDVQHWWHPHTGRGVRTRFSDDLVWLPFTVEHYVETTGDESVLDERTPYLKMRELEPEEAELYELPEVSEETGTVYEHCVRVLDHACTRGPHDLPLIGGGDWNDGMNRVGIEGRGESVWLAWFLVATLRRFAALAEARDDAAVARRFRERADAYAAAVEASAWDGDWYRRAYFDDGTPLGSRESDECRIDAIAQSWSVISGAGDPDRARRAMRSLEEHLVDPEARLIRLLTPAFDETPHDPGYIKGYVPGVRENGAQYTHAALWSVLATTLLGDGDRAGALFRLLNPFTHGDSAPDAQVYKVEPYVVCADVYTAEGHLGRGGWTWYTGSAAWSYRVGLEGILGFQKRGSQLALEPCIPSDWEGFAIDYRYGDAVYRIRVRNPDGVCRGVASVELDGEILPDGLIPLVDDGAEHQVEVMLGAGGAGRRGEPAAADARAS